MFHPHSLLRAALAAALTLGAAAGSAQEAGAPLTPPNVAVQQRAEIARGDPHRWYQDDATLRARLHTLRKEIAAAYTEAKIGCRQAAPSERASCLRAARTTYEQDMANARETALANR
ncbi:MAG TPA: hypothetical protein VFF16_09080 [Telluria sp.]|nr:hypothetical protein [Telluria sp.]